MSTDIGKASEPGRPRGLQGVADGFDEDAFQCYYRDGGLQRTRVGLGLGMLLVVALCVVDLILAPGGYAVVAIPWRMLTMFTPMGAALAITMMNGQRHRVTVSVTAAALLSGLGSIGAGIVAADFGSETIMWGNVFFTFYTYLVLGLPYRNAILAAWPILVLAVALGVYCGTPAEIIAPSALYLVFSNFIGMFCCHRLEHNARALYRNTQKLRLFAQKDGLTALNNRRVLDDYLGHVWAQSRREGKNLALLLIDIDAFKPFNDHYGHPAGDQCLREVARLLGDTVRRPLDFVARYGGEEFAIVLYAPTPGYVDMFAENLRALIADLGIAHVTSPVAATVTASIGAGLFAPDCPLTLVEALDATDSALYKSKQTGRNRVTVTVWGADADQGIAGSDSGPVANVSGL